MAEPQQETPIRHGHERRDVDIGWLGLCALGLAVLLAGGLALTAWVFDLFNVTPEGQGLRGAPVAASPPRPPEPRLQASPVQDMQELRRTENAWLQSYGWVDQAAGIARIPIDRAMELIAVQGLPSWHEIPAPPPTDRPQTPEEK
jgi:hypothetical protein